MCSIGELEALVKEHYPNSMIGRLAYEALRVRKILGSFMDAENSIRWAFMQYRDGEYIAPDFENYAEVKRLLIDPALSNLWPAADDALILSIMLHACLKESIDNREDGYQLSSQIVTRILKTKEIEDLESRIKDLEEKLHERR